GLPESTGFIEPDPVAIPERSQVAWKFPRQKLAGLLITFVAPNPISPAPYRTIVAISAVPSLHRADDCRSSQGASAISRPLYATIRHVASGRAPYWHCRA